MGTDDANLTRPLSGDDAHRERLARALGSAYELQQLLGSGGFAEVYSARDVGLKRDVAVKVLRQELAPEPTLVARFRREAEAVAQLRHPNIIPIYTVGDAEGIVYFIMPLVRGLSLREWLEADPHPPFDEVRRILVETADALHTAHQAGLVHRDVKPDNIMLEGSERRALVMDFGIARPLSGQDVSLTATGMIIGTPQYMSPEQGSGDGSIDHRSDIYSLGVVGYQMLAGQLPFAAGSVVRLLVQHATEQPHPIQDVRPECPSDLVAVVMRCLAKDPARRWQSAAELRDALAAGRVSQALGVPSGESEAPPTPTRLAPRARNTIGVAAAVSALAFVVDLGLGGGIDFAPFVLAVAAFVALATYGRMQIAGLSWRDLVAGDGSAPSPPASETGAGSDEAEFGDYAEQVRGARSDRSALVGLLARLPNSERALLHDVLPAVDDLLVRGTDLARKLHSIERHLPKTPDAEARQEAEVRRLEVRGEFESSLEGIRKVRKALRRVGRDGLGAAGQDLRDAMGGVREGSTT